MNVEEMSSVALAELAANDPKAKFELVQCLGLGRADGVLDENMPTPPKKGIETAPDYQSCSQRSVFSGAFTRALPQGSVEW